MFAFKVLQTYENGIDNSYRVEFAICFVFPQINLGVIHSKLLQSYNLLVVIYLPT